MRLGKLQESMRDSIRQAAAEVHDFVCFATFVDLIHPWGCTLTSESIRDAETLASKIPFSEPRQAFIKLRQAYDLQTPIPGHRLSKARELPTITKFAMEEWHRDYLSHVATTGIRVITFGIVFRWWIDYQRKLMSSDQEKATPIVQALIDQGYISKTKWAEADSMSGLCKNIPLPSFVKPNPRTETQLPIYTQFKVHPQGREDFQEFQKILGQIYSLFEKDSCSALAIISKAYYTKKENYLKIMAGDQQMFSRKYLNAASYFFNLLRWIKAVVFKNQSHHFWHDKFEVSLFEAVIALRQDPPLQTRRIWQQSRERVYHRLACTFL
ncbi:hypothetical protein L873DRAFT_1796084 [Choiromyces venosus 120613-1]|uniref:Uncharacterized protein n=1 Tax=Choiromyces venosus 120613-1 TaxID=1336337 RepID=A0A3N4IZ04_9PEZI|nr:hypothetical protein L873DRAFT_1796084 [Choiromyces venosus 120613-1]